MRVRETQKRRKFSCMSQGRRNKKIINSPQHILLERCNFFLFNLKVLGHGRTFWNAWSDSLKTFRHVQVGRAEHLKRSKYQAKTESLKCGSSPPT